MISDTLSEHIFSPDWQRVGNQHQQSWVGPSINLSVRRLVKNLTYGKPNNLITSLLKPGRTSTLVLGSRSNLLDGFLKDMGEDFEYIYPSSFIEVVNQGVRSKCEVENHISDFVHKILDHADHKFRLNLKRFHHDLTHALIRRHMFLMSVHAKVVDSGEKKNRTLIVGEPSKPVHKAISVAWRQMGGVTYGLHHGHAVGELTLPDRTFHEFFAYDKFICPNQEAQKAFENDVLIADPNGAFCNTDFVSMRDQSKTFTKNSAISSYNPISHGESVLIMGFPMNAQITIGRKGFTGRHSWNCSYVLPRLC